MFIAGVVWRAAYSGTDTFEPARNAVIPAVHICAHTPAYVLL